MTLHSVSERRRDYLYIRIQGRFDPFIFNQIILEAAFRGLSERLNGLLIDIFHVWGFGSKALEALEHAESLCCMLPEYLKYAFLTKCCQMKEREFIQAVFGYRGLEVKSASHLREAVSWLRGTEMFIPSHRENSDGVSSHESVVETTVYSKAEGLHRRRIYTKIESETVNTKEHA